jgi:serine phosphatase RsbU (regulator of sigma subunit)
MLPRETLESIQDLIFILVYKLHLPESDILSMKRWIMKKRYKQFDDYQKTKNDEIKKQTELAKSQMPRVKK